MQLSEELTSTENKVSFARQAYNESSRVFPKRRASRPFLTSVFASACRNSSRCGFTEKACQFLFADFRSGRSVEPVG